MRNDIKTMKVATYSRVSTQKREQKPEVQVQELRRYCKARGFKITHEIIDRASGGGDDRTGLKKLLSLVRAREVDAVVVVKLDRLFRSLKHLVNTLSEFEALGVKFIATRDQVDLTTPAGRMFVQILGSLGEFERALIRERIMLGLDHAVRVGKRLGRPKTNDDDAIKTLRTQGKSYSQIEKQLKTSSGAVWRALRKKQKKPASKIRLAAHSVNKQG
ncbi:MAG: recombinase family protein [Ignavibacteriales bacterium]|nr:recombinase family protein [Ignavibacteriales bacterium]